MWMRREKKTWYLHGGLLLILKLNVLQNAYLRPTSRRGVLERPTFCNVVLGKLNSGR